MPRFNVILVSAFAVVSVIVFIAALTVPAVRAFAYAPARELLLPPPRAIEINLLYSTEKEGWLKQVLADIEVNGPRVDGRPLHVNAKAYGSREMYLAVLDGNEKPDMISPASSLQIEILDDLSRKKSGGVSLVNRSDTATCRSVLQTPVVLVAWKQRADVLWGNDPGPDVWKKLHDALVNPRGWEAYGHPEWGFIKFGHTDPLKSNSGFQTILLLTYDFLQKSDGLTSQDILTNGAYQTWFSDMERNIGTFESSTGTYMNNMVAYGPSVNDIAAVYESNVIEQAANAVGRYGELRAYYPPTTTVSDHPFCILQGDWVSSDARRGSQALLNYLTSEGPQSSALLQHGFRPVNSVVKLDQPASPFVNLTNIGIRADLPPQVAIPQGDVLNTLLDYWSRVTQR